MVAKPVLRWTVAGVGAEPLESFTSAGSLGSGCGPGSDDLPDGVWFGWITATDPDSLTFDLACLWPGRIEPAASNDSTRTRQIATSPETLVHGSGADPVSFATWGGETTATVNAPGLPQQLPFWVFVNDGVATELSEHSGSIDWRVSESAWPNLIPGCCEEGTVAPPSPTDPWPADGWPADGFYATGAEIRVDRLELTLWKWVRCTKYPDLCPPWWTGNEVTTDPDSPPLTRTAPLDGAVTVVILPMLSDRAIIGDGHALEALLDDLNESLETWWSSTSWDELEALSEDPMFPFGSVIYEGEITYEYGYRGPGGAHLTPYGDRTTLPGWTALEVRNGRPILYLHAGIVAG